jgi:hypothetical protein
MLANALISQITGVRLHDYGCTLKAYRRDVLQGVRLYGEMHRFIPALCSWIGGDISEVVVSHYPRVAGKSKYGIGRTFRVILDLFTVKFLLRFTGGPMQLFGKIAFLFGGAGVLMLAGVLLDRLFGGIVGGDYLIKRPFWVITPFMLLAFCMQFLSMGLLAELQTRTYHESQNKRIYSIRETFDSPGGPDGSIPTPRTRSFRWACSWPSCWSPASPPSGILPGRSIPPARPGPSACAGWPTPPPGAGAISAGFSC